jgi:iron uptake system component EfeO
MTIENRGRVNGMFRALAVVGVMGGGITACGGDSNGEQSAVATSMQQALKADLTTLWNASKELQAAAPAPTGRGWDKDMDAAAITAMKAAWVKARTAYEHVEGATAPIFSDIDVAIDERYDGFPESAGAGDHTPFDDDGVTGMHAIERILYVDVTPTAVVKFEMDTLPGYVAAGWPKTEAEAADFKNKLCARLVTDTKTLLDGWTPQKIAVANAFNGLIGLVNEQQEKVNKAATFEEESRYSQRTMADLRANLEGTTQIYALFRAWLEKQPAMGTTPAGTEVDAAIRAGFDDLDAVYGTVQGDAIPQPPVTWRAEGPAEADLQTPFGQLWTKVRDAVDIKKPDSLVNHMNDAATLLGLPGFVE